MDATILKSVKYYIGYTEACRHQLTRANAMVAYRTARMRDTLHLQSTLQSMAAHARCTICNHSNASTGFLGRFARWILLILKNTSEFIPEKPAKILPGSS
ncbi:hypothetical protein TSAR_006870, partial [Trichomalopsis sarcophagae]